MRRYSIEPRTRKYVKWYRFLSFARKYQKQSLDTGLDAVKTVSKKVLHKGGKFLGNTFPDTVTESNNDRIVKPDENSRNVKDVIIRPEKRDEILNKLRKVL